MGEQHKPSDTTSTAGRGTIWVIGQIALLAAIVLAPTRFAGYPVLSDGLSSTSLIIGLIIACSGLLLVALGALSLGSNLTIFPRPLKDGSLVQTGLYSLVRHPIYSGVLLAALGWSVARASVLSLVLTLLLGIFFDRKANREEQWLQQQFPEYGAYRRRVRKLIPWLY